MDASRLAGWRGGCKSCLFLLARPSVQRAFDQDANKTGAERGEHLPCLVRRVPRPESAENKVELKHTEASPDVFLHNAPLWERSISVGYAVLLARSFDLSILAPAAVLEFIRKPKKQILF